MTPRLSAVAAVGEGWRRVRQAPAIAAGVLIATLLAALPLALVMRSALDEHLGSSLQAEQAANGWNEGWAVEFNQQAQGLGRTFSHELLGFGASVAIISRVLDAEPLNVAVAGAVAAYIVLWMFLSGGILDRLARARPVRAAAFFAACGVYFPRFLRLAILTGAAYWALIQWWHPYLFGTLYGRWTANMTAELPALWLRASLYAAFLLPLALVNLIADFAKVRAVVEDRRSMLGAIGASLRFLRRHPFRITGLYALNVCLLLIVLAIWMFVAPPATTPVLAAWLLTQLYLLARIWTRLMFVASETVFFQRALAHAEYTAAPPLVWPDSPAAEALVNLARQKADGKGQK